MVPGVRLTLTFSFILSCIVAPAAWGDGPACEPVFTPAAPDIEFTGGDRWGKQSIDQRFGDGLRVGEIHITRLNVFDDAEASSHRLFALANSLHSLTRQDVIAEHLLFEPGDEIDAHVIAESERKLRSQRYLSNALIRPVSRCGDVVDYEVVTRDTWTVLPELKLKTSGGATEAGIGFQDSNFLGNGGRLAFDYEQRSERDRLMLRYDDNAVIDGRHRLRLNLASNSDGHEYGFEFGRPFFALGSPRSWGLAWLDKEEVNHLYAFGESTAASTLSQRRADVWRGFSMQASGHRVSRWTFGVVADSLSYRQVEGEWSVPLPTDVDLVYPYVEFSQIQDDFATGYNINRVGQVEDLHLGHEIRARLGFAPGSDAQLVFEGSASDTLTSRRRHLLQASVDWRGRWDVEAGAAVDAGVSLTLDYHRGQTANRNLYLGLTASRVWNPSPASRTVLGGATGMRGYPVHYSTGDGGIYFTAEQRLFTNQRLFDLFNVGYVAFFDMGKTLSSEVVENPGLMMDAGFGLRLVPDKTDHDHVVHIDLGWPLREGLNAQGPQVLVEVRKSL